MIPLEAWLVCVALALPLLGYLGLRRARRLQRREAERHEKELIDQILEGIDECERDEVRRELESDDSER